MQITLNAEQLERQMQAHKKILIEEGKKKAGDIFKNLWSGAINNIVISNDYINLPLIEIINKHKLTIFHSRLGCGTSRFYNRK